jgi:hypothetical protein
MTTVTIDSLFLFFLLIVFMMDLIGTKMPLISMLAFFIALVCIVPNIGTELASSSMIGWLGLLMTVFTFGMTIISMLNMRE